MNTRNGHMLYPSWVALLNDLGIDYLRVLRRVGLPEDLTRYGPVLLPCEQYFQLWTAIDTEAHDPSLPVRIGETITTEVFSPAVFAAICSPNLLIAAQRVAQHKPLVGPLRLRVTTTDTIMSLSYHWPDALQPPKLLVLTELVFWVALARITTRHQIFPLRVYSPWLPTVSAEFAAYLGVTVEHSAVQRIDFARADAQRPFLTMNPQMWDFFEPELRRRLAELDSNASVTDRVHSLLLELLPSGQASISAVAQKLMMSQRTLQRKLSDEATSFQDTLSQTRKQLALHYLDRSDLSITEITFLLGYEDPSSFYRAFREWVGQTPEQRRIRIR